MPTKHNGFVSRPTDATPKDTEEDSAPIPLPEDFLNVKLSERDQNIRRLHLMASSSDRAYYEWTGELP